MIYFDLKHLNIHKHIINIYKSINLWNYDIMVLRNSIYCRALSASIHLSKDVVVQGDTEVAYNRAV